MSRMIAILLRGGNIFRSRSRPRPWYLDMQQILRKLRKGSLKPDVSAGRVYPAWGGHGECNTDGNDKSDDHGNYKTNKD